MDAIEKKLAELDVLCEKHPANIPLADAAAFLGIHAEGLRAALMNKSAPFGFGYQKSEGAYRVFVIPTVTFYLWYTNTNAAAIRK